jgi:DNA-binding NarL/FixJ family response regulator
MTGTRLLVADDHTLILESFKALLEPEFSVVGTVSEGRALLTAAPKLKPDVIILDIAMPLLNGLEAARQLKKLVPGVKLVFVTMDPDPDLALEALRLGASGYILKTCAASELRKAVRESVRGRKYVTPLLQEALTDAWIDDPGGKRFCHSLTPRQLEVLQLLVEGRSMKQAAGILNVATRTVAYHKYRMMADLRIKSTAELVQFAVRNHILSGSQGAERISA